MSEGLLTEVRGELRFRVDGARLREMRESRGLSLRAFAARCGWGFSYAAKIERGEVQTLSAAAAVAIQEALR